MLGLYYRDVTGEMTGWKELGNDLQQKSLTGLKFAANGKCLKPLGHQGNLNHVNSHNNLVYVFSELRIKES